MIMAAERQGPAVPSQEPHRARLRFEQLPATYCHPRRLAMLLPEGLPAGFHERLLASGRLRVRLSTLLAERFELSPLSSDDLATPEGRFAQLEGKDLESALRRIGAIWHARAIRKIVMAEPLRKLIETLDRDNHRAALSCVDLAPEAAGEDVEAPDVDTLMTWIERDAKIAVNAWCRHQPASLAARLTLKLPPCAEADDEPPVDLLDQSLMIVDRVVMALATEADEAANAHG